MTRRNSIWIGMATATAVLAAAVVAHAQEATPEAAPSPTATAAAKPKAMKKHTTAKTEKSKAKKLPMIAVTVTNGRSVQLVEATATLSSGEGGSVTVAKDLPGGKKTVAHLGHDKACLFDIRATFDDGQTTDATGVDLCKDKKINFSE